MIEFKLKKQSAYGSWLVQGEHLARGIGIDEPKP